MPKNSQEENQEKKARKKRKLREKEKKVLKRRIIMKPKNISQIQMIAEYDGDIRSIVETKYDGVLPILAT